MPGRWEPGNPWRTETMQLLPSQQTEDQRAALARLIEDGKVCLCEPCDCGSQVRHNNGGNYHDIIDFRLDGGKCWRSRTFTGDYAPADDWYEVPFGEAVDEIARLAAEGYRW
jgi:hypothetical protein